MSTFYSVYIGGNNGSGGGVSSLNGLNGALSLVAGSGITITPAGSNIIIASTNSGTVTSVALTVPAFLSISGSPITSSGTLAIGLSGTALPIANGGTGQTTATTAFNALAPSQTSNSGKFLTTNGTNTSWASIVQSQWSNGSSGYIFRNDNGTNNSAVGIGFNANTTGRKGLLYVHNGTETTANYGMFNVGDGTFEGGGVGAGDFTGNTAGTVIAVNGSGGGESLVDFQDLGLSRLAVLTGGGSYGTSSIGANVMLGLGVPLTFRGATSGYMAFKAPAIVTTPLVFTLPNGDGTANQVLKTNGSGTLSWSTPASGAALSALTAATQTNTIDNLNFTQEWDWSTINGQNGLVMTANSITSGSLLQLTSSASGLTGPLFDVEVTNSNASGPAINIINNTVQDNTPGLSIKMQGGAGGTRGINIVMSSSAPTSTAILINEIAGLGLDIQSTQSNGTQQMVRLANYNTGPANNDGAQIVFAASKSGGAKVDAAYVSGFLSDVNGSAYKGALTFATANNGTPAEVMRLKNDGSILFPFTLAGSTGNQTINQISGIVKAAGAATSLTVTNSLITTSSIVFTQVLTNDATARVNNVVPGSGSFVMNLTAPTGTTNIGFWVIN